MTCEDLSDGFGARWLPILVHSGRVPVSRQLVHGLGGNDLTAIVTVSLEPSVQFDLRPEAVNVPSGEADVVPEASSWNQQVHDSIGDDPAVLHMPLEPVWAAGLAITK